MLLAIINLKKGKYKMEFRDKQAIYMQIADYFGDNILQEQWKADEKVPSVRQLAVDAEVGSLVMFHHDPDRSDGDLNEIQIENERYFKAKRTAIKSYCAAEGMEVNVSKQSSDNRTIIKVT